MEASTSASIALSIDGDILSVSGKDKAKLAVVGIHLAGLSETRRRILGELARRKSALGPGQVFDFSVDASIQEVGKTLSEARAQQSSVVFIHDFWKEIAETKPAPDWIAGDQSTLDQLMAFFREFRVIRHLVKDEDAKRIIDSYWNEHGVPPDNVRKSLTKSILDVSKIEDTHIPKLIREKLEAWSEKNPIVIEKLKRRTRLREDEEAIKSALDRWETELKEDLSNYDKLLGILGLGGASSSLLATSLGVEQGVLKVLGISAASSAFLFGLPVTLAFFFASALGFAASSRRDLPQKESKEFAKFATSWLTAQGCWEKLTSNRKEVVCYELDKKTHRKLGTALRELPKLFALSADPAHPGEDLIKQIETDLGIKLETILTKKILDEVGNLLAPISAQLNWVVAEVTEVKHEVKEVKQNVADVEATVAKMKPQVEKMVGVLGKPVELTPANLHEFPQFSIYEERWPLLSTSIREIVNTAFEALGEGRKVVILGEAGVGKTTVLYLICRSLLIRGNHIFYGGVDGPGPGKILLYDNIDHDTAQAVAKSSANPAIATCRSENWNTGGVTGWLALKLTRDDYPREILRMILIECLNADSVSYTEEGLENALNKSEGLPGYLVELVSSCRVSGKSLTKETADAAPSKSIGVIEDAILSIKNFEALKLLFSLALSSRSRLQRIHLRTLLAEGQSVQADIELPSEFLSMTRAEDESVFRLGHDLWRDALLKPWGSLGQMGREEPDNLKRLREGSFPTKFTTMFQGSIPALLELKGATATTAVRVTLENQPSLAAGILDSIFSHDVNNMHLIGVLELLAVSNPKVIREHYRRLIANITEDKTIDHSVFMLMWAAETLYFKSDTYTVVRKEGDEFITPVIPARPEFPAPTFSLVLLEEAEDLLSKHPHEVDDVHHTRAKLLSDLGSVKGILGKEDESLQLLRDAVDEWRTTCFNEEGVLWGNGVRFHDSLDNLGAALMAAEKYPEAVRCLTAAVRSVKPIWDAWSIFIKAKAQTDPDSNLPESEARERLLEFVRRPMDHDGSTVSAEVAEGLARLVSTYKEMNGSAYFAQEGNGPAEPLPDVSYVIDSAFIGPIEVIRALASSMSHLTVAFREMDRQSEWSQVYHVAFDLKTRLISIYEEQGDLPAAAEELVDIARYVSPESRFEVLNRALETYRKLVVDDDSYLPKLANALRLLASISVDVPEKFESAISDWIEAEGIYFQLASVQSRFFIDHARVAINLANGFMDRGDFIRAAQYFRRAEGSLRDSSTRAEYTELMAQVSWGMGEAESHVPDWDLAIKYYRDAEVYFAGVGSKNSDDLRQRARGMIGLGEAFMIGKNRPDLAVEPFEHGVELLKGIQDSGIAETFYLAQVIDRLGLALEVMGDTDGAFARYLQALECIRRLPLDKPKVAAGLAVELAKIAKLKEQRGLGELEKDLAEAEEILGPFRGGSGEPSQDVAFAFAVLGKVYKDFKFYPSSAACYEAWLAESQRVAQGDHRSIVTWAPILDDYAEVLIESGDKVRAVKFYQRLSEFLKKLDDQEEYVQGALASALGSLGTWLLSAGDVEESIKSYKEAHKICARLAAISKSDSANCQRISRGLTEALSRRTPSN